MQNTENKADYGIFIDLNIADTIQKAIEFRDENSFDTLIEDLSQLNTEYEVGIKQKDGTLITESFKEFKTRFFNQPVI